MDTLLEVTDESATWRAWLADFPDTGPRDTPEWAALASILEPGRPICIRFTAPSGRLVLPFLLRPVRGGENDVGSPYDFGGPIFQSGSDIAVTFAAFLPSWNQWCLDSRVVAEFFRLHPLREFSQKLVAHAESHQMHAVVDLRHGYDGAVAGYASDVRRCLKKSAATRLEVRRVPRAEGAALFAPLYSAAMKRVEAPRFYHFPQAFFEALFAGIAEAELWVAFLGSSVPVAAAIFLSDGPDSFYFLAAAEPAARESHANHVLLDAKIRFETERGKRRLHLGGGAPSLRHFKESFGSERVPYFVRKYIHQPRSYAGLVAATPLAAREALPRHFPLYRSLEFLPVTGE